MAEGQAKRHRVSGIRRRWIEEHVACPKCGEEIYFYAELGTSRRKGRKIAGE